MDEYIFGPGETTTPGLDLYANYLLGLPTLIRKFGKYRILRSTSVYLLPGQWKSGET